jgi:hypothetical protein
LIVPVGNHYLEILQSMTPFFGESRLAGRKS